MQGAAWDGAQEPHQAVRGRQLLSFLRVPTPGLLRGRNPSYHSVPGSTVLRGYRGRGEEEDQAGTMTSGTMINNCAYNYKAISLP